jgi:hypothetical protein
MITLFVGKVFRFYHRYQESIFGASAHIISGGTSGCVIAGRLAEDLNAKILVLEAGPDNADLENVHMPGG